MVIFCVFAVPYGHFFCVSACLMVIFFVLADGQFLCVCFSWWSFSLCLFGLMFILCVFALLDGHFCVSAAWRGSWRVWHECDQGLEKGLHGQEHRGVHPGWWDWAWPPWPCGKLCECIDSTACSETNSLSVPQLCVSFMSCHVNCAGYLLIVSQLCVSLIWCPEPVMSTVQVTYSLSVSSVLVGFRCPVMSIAQATCSLSLSFVLVGFWCPVMSTAQATCSLSLSSVLVGFWFLSCQQHKLLAHCLSALCWLDFCVLSCQQHKLFAYCLSALC